MRRVDGDCFRNVVRVDLALAEAYRVLKPGGRFLCLGRRGRAHPIPKGVYRYRIYKKYADEFYINKNDLNVLVPVQVRYLRYRTYLPYRTYILMEST